MIETIDTFDEPETDHSDARVRSRLMSRVRGKNTGPELLVRRLAHRIGYRFRLHARDLPGSPDMVFPSRRVVIFVHGCFWHRHAGCRRSTMPKTRTEFWRAKFARNVVRDVRNLEDLAAAGWRGEVIWECETRDADALAFKLGRILGPPGPQGSHKA